MTIPSVPEEKRAKVRAALAALGHPPTVKECAAIGKDAGCSTTTVRRMAAEAAQAPDEEQEAEAETPEPSPAPTRKANPKPKAEGERVNPAVNRARRRTGGTYRSDECCQATWRLDPSETMPANCPACGEPFA